MQLARNADVGQPIRGKQLQRVTKKKGKNPDSDTKGRRYWQSSGVGDASQTKRWHQDLVSHRQQTDAVHTVRIFVVVAKFGLSMIALVMRNPNHRYGCVEESQMLSVCIHMHMLPRY